MNGNDLPAAIRRFFASHAIGSSRIVAAVSGGTDSTALLLALCDLRDDGFDVLCAHVNHFLRGEESDGDERFVKELCARLDVECHVAEGRLTAESIRRHGIEGAARAVRYERLSALRHELGAEYVATAHQKNDQAETVLMRLITGTGLAGLRGIHPVRSDGFVRPLLEVTRAETVAFVRERNVVPREDRSNEDLRFLRNRIRSMKYDPEVVDRLSVIAEDARQCWPGVEALLDDVEGRMVAIERDSTRFRSLPDEPWLRRALLHRHIRRLDPSSREVSSRVLARLASDAESLQRVTVSRGLELIRDRGELVLRRPPQPVESFDLTLSAGHHLRLPGNLTFHVAPAEQERANGRQRFQLPRGAEARFQVRNRRPGDRFQPLGMHQPKKLKDFLIDRKIPAEIRDRIPLLLWQGQIVWVGGVEVSERFKVIDGDPLFETWTEASGAGNDLGDQSCLHGGADRREDR
ncbi:MAG TPA: tRNA lysidine(34) synthetase TilS [Thermoanaerobaculia bacterium]